MSSALNSTQRRPKVAFKWRVNLIEVGEMSMKKKEESKNDEETKAD